ncbi:MAG: translation initiation factor IF-5A [Candidatus Thorarchaeota archaeon]|nr:MAG: translation initiation factor IF-5A [Candidatus Thorarchaeota archaeon]
MQHHDRPVIVCKNATVIRMSIRRVEARTLKPGGYVIVDDMPSRVVNVEKSKPGKHGAAKITFEAVGFFDNRKRQAIMPADRMVDVPIIDKKGATVIADMGENFSLMDSDTFETYEVPKPADQDLLAQITLNCPVEVWFVMEKRVIMRVKSEK